MRERANPGSFSIPPPGCVQLKGAAPPCRGEGVGSRYATCPMLGLPDYWAECRRALVHRRLARLAHILLHYERGRIRALLKTLGWSDTGVGDEAAQFDAVANRFP